MALGGVFAGRGDLSLPLVILTGALAGVVGENVSYWFGRRFGVRIVRRLRFRDHMERNLQRAERYFHDHGGRAVLLGRYISIVGTFLPFTAGMSKMPYGRFVAANLIAMIVWAGGISTLGYFLSAQVALIDRILSRFTWGALAAIALIVARRAAWLRRDWIRDRIRTIRS